MDNPATGVSERVSTGGSSLVNGPSFRRAPRMVASNSDSGGVSIPCATFIIQKDENGYGMKVSGDNPVYVQSVKEGGAAEKAGLHSGDKIIKVNGENVTQSTHTDVVALIRSAIQVVLTVQQRPPLSPLPRPVSATMNSPSLHSRPLTHHHSAPARDRVTSPQPVDHEKLRQLECQRVRTFQLMLEKEQRYVEALRSEIVKINEPKLVQELSGAERRVRTLQDQLLTLTAAPTAHSEAEYLPPSRLHPVIYETDPEIPPPLPCRNRPQQPAPLTYDADVPPPLPPRPFTQTPANDGGDNLSGPITHCPDNHSHKAHLPTTNHHAANPHVTGLHGHHRTKSSPDPLNMQNMSLAEASKRLIASESMSDLTGNRRSRGVSWDVDSPRVTPPGTPPPPYGGNNASGDADQNNVHDGVAHGEVSAEEVSPLRTHPQSSIISMEDDDMSDQEMSQMEDHGPFKSLSKLWEHNAHLAVFMNYVISNSDPSSLLFYLVTDLYKEGNTKEMKKWAYEIHSSFLVPGAPLRLNNVDENVAREIDDVLLKESDKEEILRKIFWKARVKAKEELNEQLADFQQKRTAGLGTIFGPGDAQLDESIHDKSKELKIVETILMPKIEPYLDDIEKELVDIRRFTLGAALGTVMAKVFGLRGPHSNALLDRCPTFVSKDKSLKARFIGKSRKMTVRGHHFVAHQYFTVTYCNHCQLIIWGIGPQGYQCSNCLLNVHRHCVRVVEENCPGPLNKKEKGNDRISKLMEKIRPERDPRRKPSTLNLAQTVDRVKKQSDEGNDVDADGDRPLAGGRAGDRRPDPVREAEERSSQDGHNEDDDHHHEITHHVPKKPTSASINRSESYKERVHAKRQLRERRKTSDPNLSKTNDMDLDSQGLLSNTNSGSSSNSSLSTRSLESPSNSLDLVTNARTQEALTVTLTPNSSGTLYDSDLDSEPDPPDWARLVEEDVLKQLSPREKKRQEVINELFHTERSHVRNLKVLDQVFHRPMVEREILPPDQIQLLFSNLDEMLDIHSQFNNGMKNKRRETPLVGDLSDLLLSMFDGPAGDSFQHAAATFCARQQIALESLKERRRKDAKLNSFLTDAEVNPMCRRLQLKDIIPTALQRLTKYPLLFENLVKYTTTSEEETALIRRAVERSKEILNHVNHAVREAEDNQRLTDIQKRLDKSAFDKVDHPMSGEYKTLDLTKHRLIYEGNLNWRIGNRTKLIDLHVVLLDDVIILLQKQDEKFVMKFYSMNMASGGGGSPPLSPIIKVSTVLVRPNAVDKKALYLVNTSQNGAQIYDLVATSSSERKTWFRHISEAAEAYKTRDGKNRGRPEPPATSQPLTAPTTDIDNSDAVQEKTKETEESSNETKAPATGSDAVASRGVTDHESSATSNASHDGSSTGDPATEPCPASPLSDSAEAVTKKLGGGGQLSPPAGAQQRRMEPLRLLTEESPLIQPTEVVVSQRSVLTAEPVLTPIEKLRRKDEAIRIALSEKQQLVADILHVPREEFATIAELAGEPNVDKDATELVLAAVNQAHQLSTVLNDTLLVSVEAAVSATSEVVSSSSPRAGHKASRLPGVPTYKLQSISDALNMQLTELLKIIKHRDEEREQLRRELQKHREQIHALHENRSKNHLAAAGSPSRSRPSSCVSVGSSHHDSEDDTGLQRLAQRGDAELLMAPTSQKGIELPKDLPTDEFVDALTDSELETQIDDRAGKSDKELGATCEQTAEAVDEPSATCDDDASVRSIPLPAEEVANVSGV